MQQENKPKKNNSALLWIAAAVLIGAGGTVGLVVIIAAVLIYLIIKVIQAQSAKNSGTADHTHDRIDHSSDIRIQRSTGKVANMSSVSTNRVCTPQEHWKEQLDGLLANGTIDRSEYRELLKQFK